MISKEVVVHVYQMLILILTTITTILKIYTYNIIKHKIQEKIVSIQYQQTCGKQKYRDKRFTSYLNQTEWNSIRIKKPETIFQVK